MKCKITKLPIQPFMSFGRMPLANGFLNKNEFNKEFFFDMEIGFSENCSLFQLKEHPSPEQMFNNKYPFFTSSSEVMKLHFQNYSNYLKKNYIKNNSKIIEIGSNDGTFLRNYKNSSIEAIGFEPSLNVSNEALKHGINSKNNFFNLESVRDIKKFHTQTDIICAANVICHIPDLASLFKSVDKCLNKNGLFIFEEPYLGSMFEKTSYDQIYDEHIFMFSASSVQKICLLFDMELIDILKQETHGGSLRYVCARKNVYKVKTNVNYFIDKEKKNNLDNIHSCFEFKKNCENSKKNLKEKLLKLKEDNKKICGYAATSKSTTILNYCNIGTEIIDFICDTTPEKIGKFSPGMHIPIKPINYFHENYPDIAFLFAWNHKEEIFEKEKEFSNKGKWFAHVEL